MVARSHNLDMAASLWVVREFGPGPGLHRVRARDRNLRVIPRFRPAPCAWFRPAPCPWLRPAPCPWFRSPPRSWLRSPPRSSAQARSPAAGRPRRPRGPEAPIPVAGKPEIRRPRGRQASRPGRRAQRPGQRPVKAVRTGRLEARPTRAGSLRPDQSAVGQRAAGLRAEAPRRPAVTWVRPAVPRGSRARGPARGSRARGPARGSRARGAAQGSPVRGAARRSPARGAAGEPQVRAAVQRVPGPRMVLLRGAARVSAIRGGQTRGARLRRVVPGTAALGVGLRR